MLSWLAGEICASMPMIAARGWPMVASMSEIHPRIEMPVLDWSEMV